MMQPTAGSSSSYPRWLVLKKRCSDEPESSYPTGDPNTITACLTTAGCPIRVSVRVAPPPAESCVCIQVADRAYASVVMAHGASVLIEVGFDTYPESYDHFVYNAGTAVGNSPRPPMLSLLPRCYRDDGERFLYGEERRGPVQRYLDSDATGLLQRGGEDDNIVVAVLNMRTVSGDDKAALELVLFRSGEWSVKRPTIITNDEPVPSSWKSNTVIPVGDRMLCWVDLLHGLVICFDVFDEEPILRFVSLPVEVSELTPGPRPSSQNACATSDGSNVKFVAVVPRCCCGGVGATFCRSSHDAYTIRTWTLSLNNDDNTDDMAWVMDGMMDATELWGLDAYHGLPRVQLAYPIVSMEEPHVIFFMVCESFYVKKRGDETKWLLLVDMKSKTVRSVYRYDKGMGFFHGRIFIPSSLSGYFSSSPSCGDCASSVSKSNMSSDESPPLVIVNEHQLIEDATKLKAASPEETILATLQEIPGLAREDMLKAYSILNHDSNGRRFKSLLGLPMNLRKEWLLIEIKTSESCSVCSACTANSQLG
ncbi:unnamed protein product [Urochloa decumbens]|uniref:DUF1618 domain-containing protein n=1 Tax=Urochloa decumbens TaxID=240449 RepID=A0ABC9GXB7_9POAL